MRWTLRAGNKFCGDVSGIHVLFKDRSKQLRSVLVCSSVPSLRSPYNRSRDNTLVRCYRVTEENRYCDVIKDKGIKFPSLNV